MTSVVATAPVRVADVGGWTDTWFGAPGQVCHLGVGPGVSVEACLVDDRPPGSVHLWPRDLGPRYAVPIGGPVPGTHPLLDHAIAEALDGRTLPDGTSLDLTVASAVPVGASLGTSAAVLVALIGAVDAVLGVPRPPAELAVAAHRAETVRAEREAGVQDHWAAAFGGAGLLTIGPYPDTRRAEVELPPGAADAIGERLVTVVFGAHDSSAVHRQVIDAMIGCGGAEHDRARRSLRRLATAAVASADALGAGDVDRWAEVLRTATDIQADLHPDLVGAPHRVAIACAERLGAAGWKVNGAGGDGGSLTVVAGAAPAAVLADALAALDASWQVVDLTPATGFQVS